MGFIGNEVAWMTGVPNSYKLNFEEMFMNLSVFGRVDESCTGQWITF